MADAHIQILARAAIGYKVAQGCSVSGDPQARSRYDVARIQGGERGVIPCRLCKGKGLLRREEPDEVLTADRIQCPDCHGTKRRLYRESVELRAYCGDPVARSIVPCNQAPLSFCTVPYATWKWLDKYIQGTTAGWEEWVFGLNRWGKVTMVRAACAAARVTLPKWEHEAGWVWTGLTLIERDFAMLGPQAGQLEALRPRRAIEAVEAWLECPCEEHREVCYQHMLTLGLVDRNPVFWALLDLLGSSGPESTAIGVVQAAARLVGTEQLVREAICAALIEWVL